MAAGRYSSEAEVVADALKQYLADRTALLPLLDPAIEQLDRGDGRPFDAEDTKRRGGERRPTRGRMPKVIVAPLAQADVDEIWDHIARDSILKCRPLRRSDRTAVCMLADNPRLQVLRDDLRPGLRCFAHARYLIHYRPIRGGIEVVRVVHGAREQEALFRC